MAHRVKCGVPIADFTAGLYAAFSISAMLTRVRAGGPGGQIDVPMFATSLAIAALQTSEYFGTGRDPRPWARPIPATRLIRPIALLTTTL